MIALTEKQFQQRVLDLAALKGWKAYHTHDSRRSQPGWPDLVLIRGQRGIFAELKTDTGRVSAAQQEWLDAIAGTGAEVAVWRPRDWPAVVAALT